MLVGYTNRYFFEVRRWLIRIIAAGDAVAMNFSSSPEACVVLRDGQNLLGHDFYANGFKYGIRIEGKAMAAGMVVNEQ